MPLRLDIVEASSTDRSVAMMARATSKIMTAMMITTIPMGTGFTRAP